MKLITEHIEQDLDIICEAKKNGEKDFFIEGVFMQSNQKIETVVFTKKQYLKKQ